MRNKTEKALLILTPILVVSLIIFASVNWETLTYLFKQMLTGVSIVKEYILSLGILGVLLISLIVILCFFFPVISSLPVQIASAVSYGLPFGLLHITLSIFIASQLVFLFTRTFYALQSEKQRKKHKALEERIKNSKRGLEYFILFAYLAPFFPFMLIHMVAASSGMKWWKYSILTLLGPIPDIFVTLWFGEKIMTTSSPLTSLIILIFVLVCVILSIAFKDKIINKVFGEEKEKNDGE